jgi:hypothetical protein
MSHGHDATHSGDWRQTVAAIDAAIIATETFAEVPPELVRVRPRRQAPGPPVPGRREAAGKSGGPCRTADSLVSARTM